MKLMITRVSSTAVIVVSLCYSVSFGGDVRLRRAGPIYFRMPFLSGTSQESFKHFERPGLYFGLEYDSGSNAL
jgi:hypothetical protein